MNSFASLSIIATLLLSAALPPSAMAGEQLFTPGSLPTGFGPNAVAAADLNGDGHVDLAVVEAFFSQVVVLLGDGLGGFGPPLPHPVGFQPQALLLLDLDGDGVDDLVTADAGASAVSVSLGLGDGRFAGATAISVGTQPRSLAAADIDGDGDLDVAVGHDSQATPICILLGDGNGSLNLTSVFPPGFAVASLALADVAGDALPELLLCDATNTRLGLWERTENADGGFELMNSFSLPSIPGGLAVADLDADGHADVTVALAAGKALVRYMGQGSGDFGPGLSFSVGDAPSHVRLVDINGDELLDAVALSNVNSSLVCLLGDGMGGFGVASSWPTGSLPSGLASADLDGDFFDDIIVANSFGSSLSTYIATSGPWVSLGGNVAGAWGPASLETTASPVPRGHVGFIAHGAPPATPGLLFLGITRLDAPFFGGTLVPHVAAALSIRAESPLTLAWPAQAPPGLSVYVQAWFRVGNTVVGTDGLRAVTQSP